MYTHAHARAIGDTQIMDMHQIIGNYSFMGCCCLQGLIIQIPPLPRRNFNLVKHVCPSVIAPGIIDLQEYFTGQLGV